MHADALSNAVGNSWYSVVGLVLFIASFTLIVIRVVRMDRSEIEKLSRLPLDSAPPVVNGDSKDE